MSIILKEGEKQLFFFAYGTVTLPEELEPADRNLSASQAGRVSSPGVDCRLFTCVDGFPACQISRLH